jgi:AcrR family transcriptional regulator
VALRAILNAFRIVWRSGGGTGHYLNMFKQPPPRAVPQRKGSEDTRRQIFETALALFREQGFERTTMRDVAGRVGVSLGAAYYYFASKDAIIGAYYDHLQDVHAARCREAFAASPDLRGRLRAALHSKVDVLQDDRRLLRALFRYGADPDHELSWFGPATAQRRRDSIALFAEALAGESLPADLRDAGPTLLWALHMGVLLFFVYDESPDQRRTRRLIDATVDVAVDLRRIVTSPLLRPVRRRLLGILGDAGLLGTGAAPAKG